MVERIIPDLKSNKQDSPQMRVVGRGSIDPSWTALSQRMKYLQSKNFRTTGRSSVSRGDGMSGSSRIASAIGGGATAALEDISSSQLEGTTIHVTKQQQLSQQQQPQHIPQKQANQQKQQRSLHTSKDLRSLFGFASQPEDGFEGIAEKAFINNQIELLRFNLVVQSPKMINQVKHETQKASALVFSQQNFTHVHTPRSMTSNTNRSYQIPSVRHNESPQQPQFQQTSSQQKSQQKLNQSSCHSPSLRKSAILARNKLLTQHSSPATSPQHSRFDTSFHNAQVNLSTNNHQQLPTTSWQQSTSAKPLNWTSVPLSQNIDQLQQALVLLGNNSNNNNYGVGMTSALNSASSFSNLHSSSNFLSQEPPIQLPNQQMQQTIQNPSQFKQAANGLTSSGSKIQLAKTALGSSRSRSTANLKSRMHSVPNLPDKSLSEIGGQVSAAPIIVNGGINIRSSNTSQHNSLQKVYGNAVVGTTGKTSAVASALPATAASAASSMQVKLKREYKNGNLIPTWESLKSLRTAKYGGNSAQMESVNAFLKKSMSFNEKNWPKIEQNLIEAMKVKGVYKDPSESTEQSPFQSCFPHRQVNNIQWEPKKILDIPPMSLPGSRRKLPEDEAEEIVDAQNQVNSYHNHIHTAGELIPLNKKLRQSNQSRVKSEQNCEYSPAHSRERDQDWKRNRVNHASGIGHSGLEFEEKHWVHNSRIGVFNRVDLKKPISIPQLLLQPISQSKGASERQQQFLKSSQFMKNSSRGNSGSNNTSVLHHFNSMHANSTVVAGNGNSNCNSEDVHVVLLGQKLMEARRSGVESSATSREMSECKQKQYSSQMSFRSLSRNSNGGRQAGNGIGMVVSKTAAAATPAMKKYMTYKESKMEATTAEKARFQSFLAEAKNVKEILDNQPLTALSDIMPEMRLDSFKYITQGGQSSHGNSGEVVSNSSNLVDGVGNSHLKSILNNVNSLELHRILMEPPTHSLVDTEKEFHEHKLILNARNVISKLDDLFKEGEFTEQLELVDRNTYRKKQPIPL